MLYPYLAAAGIMLSPMVLNAWLNALTFRRLTNRPDAPGTQKVSILVPARNEAPRIRPLLDSFLRLDDDVPMELLIYDDDSTDGMGDLIRGYSARDARIRVIGGQGPPPGWTGRTNGLHRLSQAATGDWFIFSDADVVLVSGGIEKALHTMRRDELEVLTLYPEQIMDTFAERAFVPLMVYYFYLLGPQWLHRLGAPVPVKPLNGQFNMWRRSTYESVGGYAAIPGAWLDDMGMGRHLADQNRSVCYRSGVGVARCRMYEGLFETWHGFAKHAYECFGLSAPTFLFLQLWLFITHVAVWSVPLIAQSTYVTRAEWRVFWIIAAATLSTRLVACVQTRGGLLSALLHPLTMAAAIANGLYSYAQFRAPTTPWKGRTRVNPATGAD